MNKAASLYTILIIDDEEAIRDYMRESLERAGYKVIEADNGKTALELLTHIPVDIIISDLVMPEKEGIETIKEIKELYPKCAIIAMSGSVFGSAYLPMARMLGAQSVMQKPFTKQTLLQLIDSIITNPCRDKEI